MKQKQRPSKPYPIPSRFNVHYGKFWIGLVLFLDVDTIALIGLTRNTNFQPLHLSLVLFISFYFLGLLLAHLYFVHGQIMKKQFIILNQTALRYKTLFQDQSIEYTTIDSMEVVYPPKRGATLKIITSKDGVIQRPLYIPYEDKFANICEADFIHTLDKMRVHNKLLMH